MPVITYTKHDWISGETITANLLNRIENQIDNLTTELTTTETTLTTVQVPSGGEPGQVLTKAGSTNYNVTWKNPTGGNVQTVNVTETTPTINAQPNFRYICGTVTSITIVPPIEGICEVVFTSGTSITVLNATGVSWPGWFDATALDANTTYEINIANGRGVVCAWPT